MQGRDRVGFSTVRGFDVRRCEYRSSGENLDLFAKLAVFLWPMDGPWLVAGDLNIDPDVLRMSGFLEAVPRVLFEPREPT